MSTKFNFENHPGYEKLKEAFRLSNKDFLGSIELAPEGEVYISPGYKKKMAQLIKRQKRPYWKFVNTIGKRIAVFVLAILLVLSVATMSVRSVREPIFAFIENVFESFSELFVGRSEINNAPDTIEEVYTLSDLPEGFEETDFKISDRMVFTAWGDGKSKIELYQHILNGQFTLDIEDVDAERIYLDNIEIKYLVKNNLTHAIWHDYRYSFEIIIYGEETAETIKHYVEAMKIK